MTSRRLAVWLSAGLALAGCRAVREARVVQAELADKTAGVVEEAQTVCLRDYSLSELVGFAMTNRPSVAAAVLAVADARIALRQTAADAPLVSEFPWTSPRVSVSGGYNASSRPAHHPKSRTDGNSSAGLSLQILLYDFGRNRAQVAAQIERVIAAEYDFIREGYSVFEEVADAYFRLMECAALMEVAHTNEFERALHLQRAQERLELGEAQSLDVETARMDVLRAREETIAASNNLATCGARLMKSLGLDASCGAWHEVYPLPDDSLTSVWRGFTDTRSDVRQVFDLARTNTPAMAIARARMRAADHNVDYAIADLMPTVTASVGLNWSDPLWAWNWGVNAVQSVFQGFKKTSAVDRAVIALQSAAVAVDEAEQKLSLEIEDAIARRDNSVKARETAKASVAAARENYETVKAKYQTGEASRVDFSVAVSSYTSALGRRVSAFYAGQIAESKLFALLGTMPEYNEEIVKEAK